MLSADNSNIRSASFSTYYLPNTNAKSAHSLKRSSSATKAVDAASGKTMKSSAFFEVTLHDIISHIDLAISMQPLNGLNGISLQRNQLPTLISTLMSTDL